MRARNEAGASPETSSAALSMKTAVGPGLNPLLANLQGPHQQRVSDQLAAYGPLSPNLDGGAENELGEKESKIDLDAAYRAVNIALAGLDLGGKRHQPGSTQSKIEQKRASNPVVRGLTQQKIGFKAPSLQRSRGQTWGKDGQFFPLPDMMNSADQLQQMQLQIQQGFQEPRFRPAQSTPPPVAGNNDVRFLGSLNSMGGVGGTPFSGVGISGFTGGNGCIVPDEGGGKHLGLGVDSSGRGNVWDSLNGLGYSPQQQGGIGCLGYGQALLSQNKQVNQFEANSVTLGSLGEYGVGTPASFTPLKGDILADVLGTSPPYSLAANVDNSQPTLCGIGSRELGLNYSAGVMLPDSLDSLDDGDTVWQPDNLQDVNPLGKATDPKTKSEQAMLLAITGILKCAVEGNLAHEDVLSDLNFLIVTVRRHLTEYQILSSEAAETLLLICSTLPTACKCARFNGDVIDSLKRFMKIISTGHPILQSQYSCLNGCDLVSHFEPKLHSEVQHTLRRIQRKLTGGTASNGVQHVALALFDAVGDKCSSQSSSTAIDIDSHGSSPKSLPLSLVASRSTAAGSQSPGLSDGDGSSTASGLSFIENDVCERSTLGDCVPMAADAIEQVGGADPGDGEAVGCCK